MADVQNKVVLPSKLVNKAVTESVFERAGDGQSVPRDNRRNINESVTAERARNDLTMAIRGLYAREGTFSTAAFNYVEVAMSGYTVKAYNSTTGQFDYQGSLLAQQIIASMDTLYDYSLGYGDKNSFDSLLEQCLLETVLTGTLVNELVLNKTRFPEKITVIPFETIEWKNGKGKKFPRQNKSVGDPVDLDIATVFVTEMHRQANRAYTDSMLSAGVSATYQFSEFLQEMRRAVRRQGHGRLVLVIKMAEVMEALSEEIKSDPKVLQSTLDDIKNRITQEIGAINPEDALVMYDTVEADLIHAAGEKSDYVPLINTMSGQLATSLKSSPSVLGLRVNGSQSLSNTESLIFLKAAKAVRRPVETNISRILTLAARLYGSDVYVKFRFDPIDLRPEMELEAFKTMRQARILEQLSEGFLTDEEAAWELGTGPRATGAPKLSGTGFLRGSATAASKNAEKASPNDDPQGRALQGDSPKKGGGKSQ